MFIINLANLTRVRELQLAQVICMLLLQVFDSVLEPVSLSSGSGLKLRLLLQMVIL
jgi:hypothetical protein